MTESLQGLQARLGPVGILIARIIEDHVLIGLRGIDIEFLSLQALAPQQGHLRMNERPRSAGTVDLRQFEHDALAIAPVIGTVGIVQVVVHGPAGAAASAEREGNDDQGTHGYLLC